MVGGAWYYVEKKSEKPSATEQVVENEEPRETGSDLAGRDTFGYLLGLNEDITCDFEYVSPDTNAAVAGTVNIAAGNIRADFEMEQAGEVYQSHLIQTDQMIYTWTESSQGTFAFASSLEAEAQTANGGSPTVDRSLNMSQSVDYDCQPWGSDDSLFVPPSDIEFQSQAELLRQATPDHGAI